MDLNKTFVIDIESNGLLEDMITYKELPYRLNNEARLWCVVIQNVGTGEIFSEVKEAITKEWLQETLSECEYLIAHNGLKFDFPALKLFGIFDYKVGYIGKKDTLFGKPITIIDTLTLSRLLHPDRYNGHSLDSWGERVGNKKTDFRQLCIDKEYIDAKSPKGQEFRQYVPEVLDYCIQDVSTNIDTFFALSEELNSYPNWMNAFRMETKLADLAIQREHFGFSFDKELAIECVKDLTEKIDTITASIEPILPPRKMIKGELQKMTPPKNQFKKDGSISAHLEKFIAKFEDAMYVEDGGKKLLVYKDKSFELPYHEPIESRVKASVKDIDHIKMYLIHLGWQPSEWRERDLTKDSKKQNLPYEKRIQALERWYEETMNGKYKEQRLAELDIPSSNIMDELSYRLLKDAPVRVPTSPTLRVGVEKELCPSLVELGDKVAFAEDYAKYLTYKHRRSSIAGGDIEDIDFDVEYPNKGYLSMYREEDGRVPTPAIEIGAGTHRYRHIGICNVARPTSMYGKELRSLFRSGDGGVFFGFDYSSIEARIMAHYVYNYTDGVELGKTFVAEKPNDLHSITAIKQGIPRSEAKSINYALLYGANWLKIKKMTRKTEAEAKALVDGFWDQVVALKEFRDKVVEYWERTDKKYVPAIDGRKIFIRSKHSILNALFQSAGVIFAKYVAVLLMEKMEEEGLCINPFDGVPDVISMIEYHDEEDLFVNPKFFKFETFETKDGAKAFVESWEGEQLSAIGEGKKGYFVCLPNVVSRAITTSMREVEEKLKLNVEMGFEYMLGKTWYDCH